MRIKPSMRQSRLTSVRKKLTLALVTLGKASSRAMAGEAPRKNVMPGCVRQHSGRNHQTRTLRIAAIVAILVARTAGMLAGDDNNATINPTTTKTPPIMMASLKHHISHRCSSQYAVEKQI